MSKAPPPPSGREATSLDQYKHGARLSKPVRKPASRGTPDSRPTPAAASTESPQDPAAQATAKTAPVQVKKRKDVAPSLDQGVDRSSVRLRISDGIDRLEASTKKLFTRNKAAPAAPAVETAPAVTVSAKSPQPSKSSPAPAAPAAASTKGPQGPAAQATAKAAPPPSQPDQKAPQGKVRAALGRAASRGASLARTGAIKTAKATTRAVAGAGIVAACTTVGMLFGPPGMAAGFIAGSFLAKKADAKIKAKLAPKAEQTQGSGSEPNAPSTPSSQTKSAPEQGAAQGKSAEPSGPTQDGGAQAKSEDEKEKPKGFMDTIKGMATKETMIAAAVLLMVAGPIVMLAVGAAYIAGKTMTDKKKAVTTTKTKTTSIEKKATPTQSRGAPSRGQEQTRGQTLSPEGRAALAQAAPKDLQATPSAQAMKGVDFAKAKVALKTRSPEGQAMRNTVARTSPTTSVSVSAPVSPSPTVQKPRGVDAPAR